MMHWRVRRRFSAYLDDELTTDEANCVSTHLEICVRCRHQFRELQASEALLSRMPTALLPQRWSFPSELRLRAAAGLTTQLRSDPANGMALRAAAATLSMAVLLLLLSVGPLSIPRPEPRSAIGMLSTAERESSILASHYEPPGGWGRH